MTTRDQPHRLRRALLAAILAATVAPASDVPDEPAVWKLVPRADAETRARLEIHPVPGLDGPTGDQIWILHRQGRYGRWRDCADAAVWTDSINLSLGRPDRDTAWEPHLMLHELLSWFVPEPLAHRVAASHRKSLHACGMVWILEPPARP